MPDSFFGNRRNKTTTVVSKWMNHFVVTIECFCVPASRLLHVSRQTAVVGPGADCRSVVVTTINIEQKKDKPKELNSVIYTPVLQWFGIDVQQQVPKFLPMNLWTGSYTVFGFYNPEDTRTSSVKFIGKIGSEQVCLQEEMDTERCLTNEQWTSLSKHLEKELQKKHMFSPTHKVSHDVAQEKEAELEELDVVGEEVDGQRDSLDTGYISNKRSLEQSMFSVQHVDNTSDSEDEGSLREKQAKEKRLKIKRKDTPSHHIQHFRFSPLTQEFKGCPLEEESEATLSSDKDSPSPQPRGTGMVRPVSALGIRETEETLDLASPVRLSVKDGLCTPGQLSKSYQDLRGNDNNTKQRLSSVSGSDTEKKPGARRKKRSIISRIGGISINAESDNNTSKRTLEERKDSDFGADADDEEDRSHAGSEGTPECLSVNDNMKEGPSKFEDKETGDTIVAGREGDEATAVANMDVCQKEQMIALPNQESTSRDDRKCKEDEDSPLLIGNENLRKFSYCKVIEAQTFSVRDIKARVIDKQHTGVTDDGGKSEICKVKVKSRTTQQRNDAEKDSVRESKKLERKGTYKSTETSPRPRSRTLSGKNVLAFDEKEDRSRYKRSFSLHKRRSVSKGDGKQIDQSYRNESTHTNLSNIPEPPLTPKEAFSDA